MKLPLSSLALIPSPCLARCSLRSSALMPSGPGALRLRSTAHRAIFKLAASTAASIVASCIAIMSPGGRVMSAYSALSQAPGRFATVPSALRSFWISPALITTTASADSCRALTPQASLSKNTHCLHAPSGIYSMRLYIRWTSRLLARSSPAPSLAAGSCSYPIVVGLPAASFSHDLAGAALPFGYGCLLSEIPISSFHLISSCSCQANERGHPCPLSFSMRRTRVSALPSRHLTARAESIFLRRVLVQSARTALMADNGGGQYPVCARDGH